MPSQAGTTISSITAPDPQHLNEATAFRDLIASVGVRPRFSVTHKDGSMVEDITSYIFENGETAILALQRDASPPAGIFRFLQLGRNNDEEIVVKLPRPTDVYDVRAHRWLEKTDHVELPLERGNPKILALSRIKSTASLSAPQHLRLGETGVLEFYPNRSADISVIHVDVVDPQGNRMPQYSKTVLAPGIGIIREVLPLAINDPPGTWTIRAQDLLGDLHIATIAVEP